jgi:hypothetical protein
MQSCSLLNRRGVGRWGGLRGERKRQRIRSRNIWIQAFLSKQEKIRNIQRKLCYEFQSILKTVLHFHQDLRSSLNCTRPYLLCTYTI